MKSDKGEIDARACGQTQTLSVRLSSGYPHLLSLDTVCAMPCHAVAPFLLMCETAVRRRTVGCLLVTREATL